MGLATSQTDSNELSAAGSKAFTDAFVSHPMRVRSLADLGQILADDSGRFIRVADGGWQPDLTPDAATALQLRHWALGDGENDRLERLSYRARALARQVRPANLDYLILVPTLRCDLSCSYCQVSRASISAHGFDWSEETLTAVERLIDKVEGDLIKIEFQGGEPTLRLDIIERIIARCERFQIKSFVICTNLSNLSPQLLTLLGRDDVFISTSLDGDKDRHQRQRTSTPAITETFLTNLEKIVCEYGADKVSALPTIDQRSPPEPDDLIEAYLRFGLHSIYLRPINFQGFARKRHQGSNADHASWWSYHERFVRNLIERNFDNRSQVLEESYLSLCLRRIFRIGLDRHVDLRNPNPLGVDYLVIDHDGMIYPTDEARMLTRSGVIDLTIGNVETTIDDHKRELLNSHSTNIGDPACDKCVYQAFCGRDIVDDLSRYGRIDLPREDTFFCQRHLAMFDLAMRLIYSDDAATQYSLAKWLGLSSDRLPRLPAL